MSEDELLKIIEAQGRRLSELDVLVDRLKIQKLIRKNATNSLEARRAEDEAHGLEKEIIKLVLSWE
jgi:hypothetical protein